MSFIDTHTHLFDEKFDPDRSEMMHRSIDAGVSPLMLPNIDLTTIEALHILSDAFPEHCYPMMGLHPSSVGADWQSALETVHTHLFSGKRKYYGVAEIGLDYYWTREFESEQREAFRQQLRWAKELSLPVSIHTRGSFEDAIQIVREEMDSDKLRGIFHCFSGTAEEAAQIIALGGHFLMGISGVLTYKKAAIQSVVQDHIPLEYIVLETDAPYLPPVPHRGKRNESAYIPLIAEKVAELKNIPLSLVEQETTKNARRIFAI